MPKGFTFMVCVGCYGGFTIEIGPRAYRVCLGFVSFSISLTDIEKVIERLLKDIKKLEAK